MGGKGRRDGGKKEGIALKSRRYVKSIRGQRVDGIIVSN